MSDLVAQIKEMIDKAKAMSVKGIVGLDVGYSGIKMAEVILDKDKYVLKNFSYTPYLPGTLLEDQVQNPEILIGAIKTCIAELKTPIKKVCLGLFGDNIVLKRLSIPEGEKEEIEDNIMWESQQYIPFGSDNANIKFDTLGRNQGGGLDVVVVAGQTQHIEKWQEYITQAKLLPVVVDLNVIALYNIYELVAKDDFEELSKGTVILDIGAQSTKILIHKGMGPSLYKEHLFGGAAVTEEIQKVMGVSYEEAELLKTSTDADGNLPEEIASIIQGKLGEFVDEIKKTLNFFVAASSTEHVYHCFLTGGSSRLPGLPEAVAEFMGFEANYLDLFSKIDYDQAKFDESALIEINFIGATAIGLGMREQ